MHNLLRRLAVQSAGWLIRQHHAGLVHNGSGNGNTLLLPTGQLIHRLFRHTVHAHRLQRCQRQLLPVGFFVLCKIQRQQHILQAGEIIHQGKILHHHTDLLVPDLGILLFRQVLYQSIINFILAGFIAVNAGKNMQQGGLPGTGFADDRHHLPILNGQGDSLQGLKLVGFLGIVDLMYIFQCNHAESSFVGLQNLNQSCFSTFLWYRFHAPPVVPVYHFIYLQVKYFQSV